MGFSLFGGQSGFGNSSKATTNNSTSNTSIDNSNLLAEDGSIATRGDNNTLNLLDGGAIKSAFDATARGLDTADNAINESFSSQNNTISRALNSIDSAVNETQFTTRSVLDKGADLFKLFSENSLSLSNDVLQRSSEFAEDIQTFASSQSETSDTRLKQVVLATIISITLVALAKGFKK